LNGGVGNDALNGDAGDDTLNGDAGDDSLNGGVGDDTLNGGTGIDTLNGGDGKDKLNGGAGIDTLNGGDSKDILNGGADADTLNGDAGNDTLSGDAGNDNLNGGVGDDSLNGGADNDILTGGLGVDTMSGGTGADRFNIGFGDSPATSTGAGTNDKISDFNAGQGDTIHFVNSNGGTAAVAPNQTHADFTITNGILKITGVATPSALAAKVFAYNHAAVLPNDVVIGIQIAGNKFILVDDYSVAGGAYVELTGNTGIAGHVGGLNGLIV